MTYNRVLIASHDTPGARAAERLALSVCTQGGVLHHLYVVPDFWKGMLGDDWLNNAVTQDRFGRYLEGELEKEILSARDRLKSDAEKRGLRYEFAYRVGKPAGCLVQAAAEAPPDLVVIGAPRPKGDPGLRSRMDLEILVRSLSAPLLISPRPQA